ncbi:MAG: hypothetical protein ACR2NN_01500 [Bryobacteraceae bacterium]
MQTAVTAVTLVLGTAAAFGQEPGVRRSTIWMDAAKRGSMPVMARGKGVLTANKTVELKIPESQVKHVALGQTVSIDTRQSSILNGTVSHIDSSVVDGNVTVEAKLDGDLPPATHPGLAVDGTIQITTLQDVVYVGRPVVGVAESEGTLFKLEPDGQHAARVRVQYGQSSVNLMEVRSGLLPGDRVILSDMSAFAGQDRLRLQ